MNLFRLKDGNYTNHKFNGRALPFVALVLASFAIAPMAHAVVPAPDGGYPGGNTAEGENALLFLTTGIFNTAVGWRSLQINETGKFNTAVGAGSLFANLADENTATGAGALLGNTTGGKNTANGAFALYSNYGTANTAVGSDALLPIQVAARTRPWARGPDSIRRLVLAMCISVSAWPVLLARATAATSRASSTKRLPAESRF